MRRRLKARVKTLTALILFMAVIAACPAAVRAEVTETDHTLSGKRWTDRAASGGNRYETAAEIDRIYSATLQKNPNEVILVTGDPFADALAAGALAGLKGCPIILSKKTGLPKPTKELLTMSWGRSVTTVIFVGAGFDKSIKDELRACGVTSIDDETFAGSNRYNTAELVADYVRSQGATECALATGWRPADAVSISSWSYAYHIPILFADKQGNVRDSTLAAAKKFQHVYILGGTAAVSAQTENKIGDLADRLGGNNRYVTSRNISVNFLKYYTGKAETNYNEAVIAKGLDTNCIDALVGGPLAGLSEAPIVLISDSGLLETETVSVKTAVRNGITSGYIHRLNFAGAARGTPRDAVLSQLS